MTLLLRLFLLPFDVLLEYMEISTSRTCMRSLPSLQQQKQEVIYLPRTQLTQLPSTYLIHIFWISNF